MERFLKFNLISAWTFSLIISVALLLFIEYIFAVAFLYSLIEVINFVGELKLKIPAFFSWTNLSVFTMFIAFKGILRNDLNIKKLTKGE